MFQYSTVINPHMSQNTLSNFLELGRTQYKNGTRTLANNRRTREYSERECGERVGTVGGQRSGDPAGPGQPVTKDKKRGCLQLSSPQEKSFL